MRVQRVALWIVRDIAQLGKVTVVTLAVTKSSEATIADLLKVVTIICPIANLSGLFELLFAVKD
jgi:hypothetical protein